MAKEIRSIEILPAENGGHTVTHHYKEARREGKNGAMPSYVESEHHVFGPEEGHEMLAHVANHLEIPERGGKPESEETPQMEARSHSAKFLKNAVKAKLSPTAAKSIRDGASKMMKGY